MIPREKSDGAGGRSRTAFTDPHRSEGGLGAGHDAGHRTLYLGTQNGLENAAEAINKLFDGSNRGKLGDSVRDLRPPIYKGPEL